MIETSPQAFAASVAAFRERIAVVAESGARLTYGELDAQRRRAAAALIAAGVQRGDRVAIWCPNNVEWIVAGLAIHSVGAALVPLNTRMRGSEAAYILAKSGAKLLFSVGRFLKQHYPSLLRELPAEQQPSTLERIVVIDNAEPSDLDWNAFIASGAAIGDAEVDARAASVGPDDTLDILFTSGTTGLPKGVVTTHAQNLRTIREWSACMQLNPDDRYLIVNPFFHSFGYTVTFWTLCLDVKAAYHFNPLDARQIGKLTKEHKGTVLLSTPTFLRGLIRRCEKEELGTLDVVVTGAEKLPKDIADAFEQKFGHRPVEGYGCTELSPLASVNIPASRSVDNFQPVVAGRRRTLGLLGRAFGDFLRI